jgi:hypothetical protein
MRDDLHAMAGGDGVMSIIIVPAGLVLTIAALFALEAIVKLARRFL